MWWQIRSATQLVSHRQTAAGERRRAWVPSVLEPFVPEGEAVPVPVEDLHLGAAPGEEHEPVAAEGVGGEHGTDQGRQTVDRFALPNGTRIRAAGAVASELTRSIARALRC